MSDGGTASLLERVYAGDMTVKTGDAKAGEVDGEAGVDDEAVVVIVLTVEAVQAVDNAWNHLSVGGAAT